MLLLLDFSILQCRGFHIKLTFLSPGHFRNSAELNNSTKQQHLAQLPAAPSISVLDFCFALQSVSKQNQSEWIENYFNLASNSFISEETAWRSGSQKSKFRKFFDVYIETSNSVIIQETAVPDHIDTTVQSEKSKNIIDVVIETSNTVIIQETANPDYIDATKHNKT